MPRVSVIIPAYNNENHIADAVKSVLGQTFKSCEALIIDDGSLDATRAIALDYVRRFPGRVRYHFQENRGPGAARNRGMRLAAGEYIAFLDADDVWLPGKLAAQAALLDRDPSLGLVYCDNYFVDQERRVIPGYRRTIRLYEGSIAAPLFEHCFIITSSAVMRRSCAGTIGYFSETIMVGEDYEYFLRLSHVYRVGLVSRRLYERRMRPGSLSALDYRVNAMNDIRSLKDFARRRPHFRRRYRPLIARRLSSYHFALGYYCLQSGENLFAARHFAISLRYRVTLKSLKCLLLSPLPYAAVLRAKRAIAGQDVSAASGA